MNNNAESNYLQNEVMSATPQRLRLMLIEGAIRFGAQAVEHWNEERDVQAHSAIIRCRDILVELLATVKPEMSETAQQVADLYLYLLRTLVEAVQQQDADKISDIVGVLKIERETWAQICQELPNPVHDQTSLGVSEVEITDVPAANGIDNGSPQAQVSKFSLDA